MNNNATVPSIPGLASTVSFNDFDGFIGSGGAGAHIRQRVRDLRFSPAFGEALGAVGKITLVTFADMGCPDCGAVLPFLGKIQEAGVSVLFGEWNAESEAFLHKLLGTGRVPTVLALDVSGRLMEGAFIERPAAVHRAAAEAAGEAMLVIGKFRGGGSDDLIEEDLLKVLRGEKNDVLPWLR